MAASKIACHRLTRKRRQMVFSCIGFPFQQIFGFWIKKKNIRTKQQSKHIWFAPHQTLVEGISLKPMKWGSDSPCASYRLPLWWSPPKKADLKQIFHLGGWAAFSSMNESFSKRKHKDKPLFHAILSFELGTRTRKRTQTKTSRRKLSNSGTQLDQPSAWPPPQ